MEIEVLASGSTGNAYIISDGFTRILIECGLTYPELSRKSGFTITSIDACLCTHEHQDHSKCAKQLAHYGIDIYASAGTLKACGLIGHRVHPIKAMQRFEIGAFSIMPFETEHDAAEPLGFLIGNSFLNETLLYFTDTFYLKYRFTGSITHIMGEANYDREILEQNIKDNPEMAARQSRLLESHMSIENFINVLKATDLSRIKQIYLIHMSAANSNKADFKERVQRLTGAEVYTT